MAYCNNLCIIYIPITLLENIEIIKIGCYFIGWLGVKISEWEAQR